MTRIKILEFDVGDVDEIDLVAGMIVQHKLKSTDSGQWVLDNIDNIRYSVLSGGPVSKYMIRVEADVDDADATYFQLRWG